jgi:transcriptional regulator with XRE-family HTH domain
MMNKTDETVISRWLQRELQRNGMTPADFAEKFREIAGRAAMYYYVSGERLPTPETAEKIAKALGSQAPQFTPRPVGRPKRKQRSRAALTKSIVDRMNAR